MSAQNSSVASDALQQSAAPIRGIVYMCLGCFFISINNVVLKWMSAGYPPGEILALRAAFMAVPIAVFAWRGGGWAALYVKSPGGHLVRAGFVVVSAFAFVTGVRHLPLADATAISFAGPLFLTMMAPIVLRERVGWRRWSAVVAGFAGVLLIMRPGSSLFQWVAVLPLVSALSSAGRDLATRHMTTRESSTAILATTTATVGLAGLATLPVAEAVPALHGFLGWKWMPAGDLAILFVGAVFTGLGHYFMIETFRHAQVALVAPFRYTTIIWATIGGFLVWGDFPDAWTLAGIAVVVASGLYILHRQLVRRRERAAGIDSRDEA